MIQGKVFGNSVYKKVILKTLTGQQNITQKKGIVSDSRVRLVNNKQSKEYLEEIRLVTYISPDTGEKIQFLTNTNYPHQPSQIWINPVGKLKSFLNG